MGDVLFSYLGLCPAGNAHTELLVQDMKAKLFVCLYPLSRYLVPLV